MAYLVEVDVVSEVGVPVEFRVTSIDSSSAGFISAEDVDDTVLNLLGNSGQVHVLIVSRSHGEKRIYVHRQIR